jgi:hypothetical protein
MDDDPSIFEGKIGSKIIIFWFLSYLLSHRNVILYRGVHAYEIWVWIPHRHPIFSHQKAHPKSPRFDLPFQCFWSLVASMRCLRCRFVRFRMSPWTWSDIDLDVTFLVYLIASSFFPCRCLVGQGLDKGRTSTLVQCVSPSNIFGHTHLVRFSLQNANFGALIKRPSPTLGRSIILYIF